MGVEKGSAEFAPEPAPRPTGPCQQRDKRGERRQTESAAKRRPKRRYIYILTRADHGRRVLRPGPRQRRRTRSVPALGRGQPPARERGAAVRAGVVQSAHAPCGRVAEQHHPPSQHVDAVHLARLDVLREGGRVPEVAQVGGALLKLAKALRVERAAAAALVVCAGGAAAPERRLDDDAGGGGGRRVPCARLEARGGAAAGQEGRKVVVGALAGGRVVAGALVVAGAGVGVVVAVLVAAAGRGAVARAAARRRARQGRGDGRLDVGGRLALEHRGARVAAERQHGGGGGGKRLVVGGKGGSGGGGRRRRRRGRGRARGQQRAVDGALDGRQRHGQHALGEGGHGADGAGLFCCFVFVCFVVGRRGERARVSGRARERKNKKGRARSAIAHKKIASPRTQGRRSTAARTGRR